ncbi:MAG: helix-turn-helix transcriptional regulator [Candidatus Omnitrophota bacterium]
MANFNIKLQSRIKELGLKNYDVAYACHMHESDLSRILNGRQQPNEAQKERLCNVLKSALEDIGLS